MRGSRLKAGYAVRIYATDTRRDTPLAVVAAATTWVTMLAWRGFASDWGAFLGPLLVVALAVTLGGVALRLAPLARHIGISVHVLLAVVVVWFLLGGSLLNPLASTQSIGLDLQHAWASAQKYTSPVPETVPSIAPLMIVCGAGALLVVDVLVCWLRRAPLAGLPLLAVYCSPVIGFDGGVSWPVFVIAAVGFLLMMFFQQSAQVSRWGRPLGGTAAAERSGFGAPTGASRTRAGTVGGVAVVLAVVLPVFIPTLHLGMPDMFGQARGGDAAVVNPMVSMRRDMQHLKDDVPWIHITTDDPHPSYLQLAVLTEFNGVDWIPGTREHVTEPVVDGPIQEQGLGAEVPTDDYRYTISASDAFTSPWLPTPFPVSNVVVSPRGSWYFDPETMDFSAGGGTNAGGVTYQMMAAVPHPSPRSLSHSGLAPAPIQSTYAKYPDNLPPMVQLLAERVTNGLSNPYDMAVRLQDWFRRTGHFTYKITAHADDRSDPLVHFLSRGHGGRIGYCQQFASAYAVMARTLGIPARVVVGFLQPTRAEDGDWVYSSWDLHAWPELYFAGSGWVRFEPTPAAAAPLWTVGKTTTDQRTGNDTTGTTTISRPTATPTVSSSPSRRETRKTTASSTSSGFRIPWAALIGSLGVLLVVGGLALVPGAVRRARRARRLAGGAEEAWAELRDTAVDLGVSWPVGRSPHETGAQLTEWFGAEPDGAPLVRPPHGRGLAPDAEQALDRIVLMLEQVRYARSANDVPGAMAHDVRTCIEALEHGCMRGTLSRSRWLPRSVFGRSARVRGLESSPETVSPAAARDHVS